MEIKINIDPVKIISSIEGYNLNKEHIFTKDIDEENFDFKKIINDLPKNIMYIQLGFVVRHGNSLILGQFKKVNLISFKDNDCWIPCNILDDK